MGFVQELRRRNVIRVAAAYAVVAWIVIEAGSVLMPTFGAPDWAFQIYVIVVIGGFLISLVFAWIFELTPEGLKLERDVDRSTSTVVQTGRRLDFAIIVLLVIALAISLTLNVTGMREPERAANRLSIAVLPFSSLSSNPDNRLFADGVHEDLLTRLANISSLKVISRTSVMEYRDTKRNLRQIGGELGVGTVVEGSVQRSGDSVRINAQLIDAETDEHIWAKTYDRQLSAQNIFDIQSEISEEIAGALETTLTEQDKEELDEIPTQNLAAYNLYMKGRANLYERTLEKTVLAREQFEQAIELDPQYAEAYAGLADALQLLFINHNSLQMNEAFGSAKEALHKALEIDPELADAYASLGLAHTNMWMQTRTGSGNLDAATAFRKAIQLNPNHARAIMWFASLRTAEGKYDEAIELYKSSLELDPLARVPYANLPGLYAQKGHHEEALELWLKALEIHPDWPSVYEHIANHLQRLGRLDEGIAWAIKTRELSSDPLDGLNIIAAYLEFGDKQKAESVMLSLRIGPDHPFFHFGPPILDLFMGNYPESLAAFDAAIATSNEVHPSMLDFASDAALLAGDYDTAKRFTLQRFPALADLDGVGIDQFNLAEVIKLAYLSQQMGSNEVADNVLVAALPVARNAPRLGHFGHGIRDVQILALQGKSGEALDVLQQAIDQGFRGSLSFEGWVLSQDPYLQAIRGHPRFKAMQAQIADYNAVMRENVRRAEHNDSWDELRARAATEPSLLVDSS